MPKLPVGNRLDFNPNSIINASKKITAISLENLKNPVLDPDQKTLSTLEASKKLDDSFEKLQDLAGLFHSGILRIQNFFASQIKRSGAGRKGMRKMGGSNGSSIFDASTATPLSSLSDNASYSSPSSARSVSSAGDGSLDLYRRRLQADRQRFRQFYPNDDRNATATPSSRSGFIDDDALPEPSTGRRFRSPDYQYFSDDTRGSADPDFDYESVFDGRDDISSLTNPDFPEERNWYSLMFFLIQNLRRQDIILTSRVRPVIPQLSQSQIDFLNKLFTMLSSAYIDIITPFSRRTLDRQSRFLTTDEPEKDPFTGVMRNINPDAPFALLNERFIQTGEYGDEILNIFDNERRKVMFNINIIVNSWKQNTPTGQQTQFSEDIESEYQTNKDINKTLFEVEGSVEGAGRRRRGRPRKAEMTLVGAGRNFYGEKIEDSRDIPTIYSKLGVKNCPTKYLL